MVTRTVNLELKLLPQKSVNWITHMRTTKTRLHMLMKNDFFSKSVWVQYGLSGCVDTLCLKVSGRWCLCCSQNESSLTVFGGILLSYVALSKIKVAFSKDLCFVEALPDVSSTENLSDLSSWSKLVWKYGQLKKKNKCPYLKINKKSHSCPFNLVLSVYLLSFTPTCLPPHLLIIITKLCACDVMSTGLLFTLESEDCSILAGNQRWKFRNLSVVQDYFQLWFLGLCFVPLFLGRSSFG